MGITYVVNPISRREDIYKEYDDTRALSWLII